MVITTMEGNAQSHSEETWRPEERTTHNNNISKDMEMVGVLGNKPSLNMSLFPQIIPDYDLKYVHPWIKSLFCGRNIPRVPLAGRLKHFLNAWKILTNDKQVLSLVQGYEIEFHEFPFQEKLPNTPYMNKKQKKMVQVEIETML